MHADQTHGINDLRIFYLRTKKKFQFMPIQNKKIFIKILFLLFSEEL